ncbi:unnamed protein product [[Actinomadura] parvosata subsp. kistnae]|nr:unnamed protein product [Actinomadura parvosata subsp. kistnae]
MSAREAYLAGRPLSVGISLTDGAGWAVNLLGLEPAAVGCDLELVEPRSTACAATQMPGGPARAGPREPGTPPARPSCRPGGVVSRA